MEFKLKSVSKYGTAYYTREGFKQAIAIPGPLFEGKAPETLELGGEGVVFATKANKVRQTALGTALKGASDDVKKQAREAARKAQQDVLAAAGISL
jgi:hypothetical protein